MQRLAGARQVLGLPTEIRDFRVLPTTGEIPFEVTVEGWLYSPTEGAYMPYRAVRVCWIDPDYPEVEPGWKEVRTGTHYWNLGLFSTTVPINKTGQWIIWAWYLGDANYEYCISPSVYVVGLGLFTTLSLYPSSNPVDVGEAFLIYGQLLDEYGRGLNDAKIDIYVDGVYKVTVTTGTATTPEGEIQGYYSTTFVISESGRYKFQSRFEGMGSYSGCVSAETVVGVAMEPVEFYILRVKAVNIITGREIEVPFVYDTLTRKTPYEGKTTEVITLTFRFPSENFVKWEDGSRDPTRTVTISADTTLTAYYEAPLDLLLPAAILIGLGATVFILVMWE